MEAFGLYILRANNKERFICVFICASLIYIWITFDKLAVLITLNLILELHHLIFLYSYA